MLTTDKIADLRRKVETAARRPSHDACWVECIDGPLAGVRWRTSADRYANPKMITGWVETTATGPVFAAYVQSGTPGRLRFRGYDTPGGSGGGYDLP